MNTETSARLFEEAIKYIPGGVNSPVRAMKGVGMPHPLFISRAERSHVWDADGNEFIDFVSSWGPMILGWGHPEVVGRIKEQVDRGTSYGAPTELEVELARLVCEAVPSVELVRMVNSGTEATMSAVRVARGFTDREKVVKFIGCYHGHSDAFLAAAGSGVLTLSLPDSPGVTRGTTADTLLVEYNDVDALTELFDAKGEQIAALIVEPVAGNMGVVPPQPGFLEACRELCDEHGALLIFDEVITGFRVGWGGAQERYDVMPDLTTLGKIIGGGLPVGAFGGRREIMETVAPLGSTYQAGTLSGNPLAMAAGVATLRVLSEPGTYERLEALGARVATDPERGGLRCRPRRHHQPGRPHAHDVLLRGPHPQLRRRQGGRHRRLRRVLAAHARARRVPRTIAVRVGDDLPGADGRGPRDGCHSRQRLVRRNGGLICAAWTRATSPA